MGRLHSSEELCSSVAYLGKDWKRVVGSWRLIPCTHKVVNCPLRETYKNRKMTRENTSTSTSSNASKEGTRYTYFLEGTSCRQRHHTPPHTTLNSHHSQHHILSRNESSPCCIVPRLHGIVNLVCRCCLPKLVGMV